MSLERASSARRIATWNAIFRANRTVLVKGRASSAETFAGSVYHTGRTSGDAAPPRRFIYSVIYVRCLISPRGGLFSDFRYYVRIASASRGISRDQRRIHETRGLADVTATIPRDILLPMLMVLRCASAELFTDAAPNNAAAIFTAP